MNFSHAAAFLIVEKRDFQTARNHHKHTITFFKIPDNYQVTFITGFVSFFNS